MRFLLLFGVVVSVVIPAISQAIPSNVYSYTQLPVATYMGYEERSVLEGTTRDFSHFMVQAITLLANQPAQPTEQLAEEAILIVKTGELTLTLGDKRKTLGPGSVVMIMPGDGYRVENKAAQSLTYYVLHYTSNQMPDLDLYQLIGNSFWVDWKNIAAVIDHQGNSQQTVTCASVMSSLITMQVTKLAPGLHGPPPHTHRAAELIIVMDQTVQVHIAGALKGAQAGDIIFVESDVPHSITNSSQEGSTYLSLQF